MTVSFFFFFLFCHSAGNRAVVADELLMSRSACFVAQVPQQL